MDNWQFIQLLLYQKGYGVKIPCRVKFKGMKYYKAGYFIKTFDIEKGGENIFFYCAKKKYMERILISEDVDKPLDIIM